MKWFARLALLCLAPLFARAEPFFGPLDRVLVLAPHPDDESLGCGGVIQQALAAGAAVRVVFLTFGDNNELSFTIYRRHPVIWPSAVERMGLVRGREAQAAASELGLNPTNLIFLGYPDFGTMKIWEQHWGSAPPYKGMLSRKTSVPYATARRPGAPYKGEEILRDLEEILANFRPTHVFTSHPADFNRDHRALYLFTRVALWNTQTERPPQRFPYLVHHPTWPTPRGLRMDDPLLPPAALTGRVAWTSIPLTKEQAARKLAAIEAHKSQFAYSARYLMSFVRATELFGDFTGPANDEVAVGNLEEADVDVDETERVEIDQRDARIENGHFIVTLRFSRLLSEPARLSLLAFGYRSDVPFEKMPKVHVVVTSTGHAVFDQRQRMDRGVAQIARAQRSITISIPMTTLGNPQRVLTTARTLTKAGQFDGVSWRVLDAARP